MIFWVGVPIRDKDKASVLEGGRRDSVGGGGAGSSSSRAFFAAAAAASGEGCRWDSVNKICLNAV